MPTYAQHKPKDVLLMAKLNKYLHSAYTQLDAFKPFVTLQNSCGIYLLCAILKVTLLDFPVTRIYGLNRNWNYSSGYPELNLDLKLWFGFICLEPDLGP